MPLGLSKNKSALPNTLNVPKILEQVLPVTRLKMRSTPFGFTKYQGQSEPEPEPATRERSLPQSCLKESFLLHQQSGTPHASKLEHQWPKIEQLEQFLRGYPSVRSAWRQSPAL